MNDDDFKINYDLNAKEKFINFFSSKKAFEESMYRIGMETRAQLAAAEQTGLERDWRKKRFENQRTGYSSSAQGERRLIAERARSLITENVYGKAAMSALVNFSIGSGIKIQSQILFTDDVQRNKALNTDVEDVKKRWMEKDADFYGEQHYHDMERIILRSVAGEGECFKLKRYKPLTHGRVIPISYDLISMDRLSISTSRLQNVIKGNHVVDGIEYDENGQRAAYHIEVNQGFRSRVERFDVSVVEHIYMKDFVDQHHGLSWFTAAIPELYLLADIKRYKLISYKVQAAMSMVVTRDPMGGGSLPSLPDPKDPLTPDGVRRSAIEPGIMLELPYAARIESFQPASSNDLEPMVKMILQGVAISFGLSYENVTGDYKNTNFAGGRISGLNTKRNMNFITDWFVRNALTSDHHEFLSHAYGRGIIQRPPEYLIQNEQLKKVDPFAARYTTPKFDMSVNPTQDVNATIGLIKNKLKSYRMAIEEAGGDFEETMAQIQTETDLGAALGIDLHDLIADAIDPQESKEEKDQKDG